MSAPEFPFIQGTVIATNDGDILPLSSVDLYAVWVSTFAKIVTAAGEVFVGPNGVGNPPVVPASFFPPIPPLSPGVGYKPYYNLKNLYMKATKATDGISFIALLPQAQPPTTDQPQTTIPG